MRGHLKNRGKNSWSVIVYLGRDPVSGKKKYQWVSVKGTRSQAESCLTKLLSELDTGRFVKPVQLTTGEYLHEWLSDYAKLKLRPRTAADYAHKIERHVIPALGAVPLRKLEGSHLQGLYRQLLDDGRLDGKGGLASRTVSLIHRILYSAVPHVS